MKEKVKNDILLFNNNKNIETFTKILDTYPEFSKRNKCSCCGNDIFYSNTSLKKDINYNLKIEGNNFQKKIKLYDVEYSLCVCEKCVREKYPLEKNKKIVIRPDTERGRYAFNIPYDISKKWSKEFNSNSLEKCIKKYGEEEGKKRWEKYCKSISITLNKFIEKYGEEEGKRRWDSYREKQRITNTFEYKKEKYGMTFEEFDSYNKSRACTLKNLIKKHGEEEGIKIWNDYIFKQAYTTTREYFIEKYGENEGIEKWTTFNNSRLTRRSFSKESQVLFDELIKNDLFKNHKIYYATNNYEYEVLSPKTNKLYYLDFFDKDLNICIEFNGMKYHPHPDLYREDDIFKTPFEKEGKIVKEIWEKEKYRNDYLKSIGIDTIIVWECDYKKNKSSICNIIIKEIEKILYDRKKQL